MVSHRLLVVLAIAFGWSASAFAEPADPPIAELEADVDGDGRSDRIRIEHPPAVTVEIAGPAGPAGPTGGSGFAPFAAVQGTVTQGSISVTRSRPPLIVASASFAGAGGEGAAYAMILRWDSGALVKLWEGEVGAAGRERGHEVKVEATPAGVLRYQTRRDVFRCDEQPAYLYPEGFDRAQKRFRPVYSSPRVRADAPILSAAASPPAGAGEIQPSVFRSVAVSTAAGATSARELAPPREIDDGNLGTVWREELGGNGRGEFLTLTATMPDAKVAALRIVPGDTASPAAWRQQNRIKRAALLVGTSAAFWLELPDRAARPTSLADAALWVMLPEPVPARCVTFVIDDVYPGSGGRSPGAGQTAIAELHVLTTLDLAPGGASAALAEQVAAGGSTGESAGRTLRRQGAPALGALVTVSQTPSRSPAERMRLRRTMAEIVRTSELGAPNGEAKTAPNGEARAALHAGVAAELMRGLGAAEARASDREAFAEAAIKLGTPAMAAVAAVLEDPSAEVAVRVQAAAIMGRMPDPSAQARLIGLAGAGAAGEPRPAGAAADRGALELRRAVAMALGSRDPKELGGLLGAIKEAQNSNRSAAEADLWRAVGMMAQRAPAEARALAIADAMAGRLATATGYELLYRLLGASGPIEEEGVLEAVRDALARMTGTRASSTAGSLSQAEMNALRRVAASALTRSSHSRALEVLVSLSRDPDPGVRGRVIDGLAQRDDAGATADTALASRLAEDVWPQLRRRAAAALAPRCGKSQTAVQALYAAVDGDRDTGVVRTALTSLVECRAPGIAARLIAVARDAKRPVVVRARAITLTPVLGDAALAGELAALFAEQRSKAWSNKDALPLAAAAAVAMGRLGGAQVVAPLLGAAQDQAFPEIQAAAVTGLGEICPKEAQPLFERLTRSSDRRVAISARGAERRCRERGPARIR